MQKSGHAKDAYFNRPNLDIIFFIFRWLTNDNFTWFSDGVIEALVDLIYPRITQNAFFMD